jgi:hypothetical protein
MRRRLWLLLFAGLAWIPARASAQIDLHDCQIESSNRSYFLGSDSTNRMSFFGGGARFKCKDGTRIAADSVAQFQASGIIDFITHVRYTDADNRLTAGFVRYMQTQQSAIAQGDVVLTDLTTGSVIQAPVMNYYRATEQRPEALIQITSGRPHAVMISISRSDSTKRDTATIDADQMDLYGRSRFNGRGSVDLVRGDLHGTGQNASWDKAGGDLRFWGNGRLQTPDYTLTGDTVHGTTDADEQLKELTASPHGKLESTDVNVEAPRIHVLFAEGEVNRLIAVGERPDSTKSAGEEELSGLASAISRDFRLVADSIDALAPGQVLERVTAVGRAWGERLGNDLANATIPAIASHDWMKGDTVITTFTDGPPAPDDSTQTPTREVERVVAIGVAARASSIYRVQDKDHPDGDPGVNYMLAQRIIVNMKDGAVSTVNAAGNVEGTYLQPTRARASGPPNRSEGQRR